ncbi:2-desacetyl-2-hydroxyethyl bacteriochlorophyllide A dehydrogenase [Marinobacter pelagius]|uniref:2-desacetyl-2-hydroxyethyl bacteriochlorophyllide A dehydrogenase n=1 Tax=Marinobacter pelagius TaxID=379482 RepID=A0A366GKM2_9GAMM|nr:2-desacetyl-2-hydroxyethyl bacteriochlorophyllide A dehydrogenase [Marinobacter pelagius]
MPDVKAFWSVAPGLGELRPARVDRTEEKSSAMVTVQALYSGVSRGTESLVFNGRVPESEFQRMRAPFQEGDFPFPVKYGYASVGEVVDGPAELLGRRVFCLYPHQSRYTVPVSAVTPLPDELPAERAVLAANMETAINGLWDASPGIGDRIAVIGLGVVGLLVGWLANRIPGTRVTVIDTNPGREAVAQALGLDFGVALERDDHDVVFHTSGHPSGLETALAAAGIEGRIIEMSWYGDQPVPVPLGGPFHSRRLQLLSSQVGRIAPHRQPRWSHGQRLELALSLLRDSSLDGLISGETPFDAMPETMTRILSDGRDTLCHRIVY